MEKILLLGDSKVKKEIKIEEIFKNRENIEKIKITSETYSDEDINKHFSMLGLFFEKKMIVISGFNNLQLSQQERISNLISKSDSSLPITVVLDVEKENKYLKNISFDEKYELILPLPWQEELWIKYIEEISSVFNKKIEKEAAVKLIELIGKKEELLYEEIKKLFIFSDNNIISLKEVTDICSYFPTTSYEELCYDLARKKFSMAIEKFKSVINMPNFSPISLANYIFRYFLDLYAVILNTEKKLKYTWPEIMKISQKTEVSSQRVANFLGFSFKTDKGNKLNLQKMYDIEYLEKILIKIENLDRLLKIGENSKVLFVNFFDELCNSYNF